MRILRKIIAVLSIILLAGPVRAADDADVSRLFRDYADAIVVVAGLGSDGGEGRLGTGFVVDEEGVIVTNFHIVAEASRIIVKMRGNKAYKKVQLINADPEKDIAVLRVYPRKKMDKVRLGNSRRVRTGQRVIAIGNPLGLENTVSDGLISSIRKTDGMKLFQISVPLSQGSSGGPLFDTRGRVVGITTASLARGQNLNFAVPVNYVKRLLRGQGRAKRYREMKSRTDELHERITLALPDATEETFHTVQRDETLYGLARQYDTTIDKIAEANGLNGSTIFAGQKLKIPGGR